MTKTTPGVDLFEGQTAKADARKLPIRASYVDANPRAIVAERSADIKRLEA